MNSANGQAFCEYYEEWMELYKRGAVREATYQKYQLTLKRLKDIAPNLKMRDLDKRAYQGILNEFAKTHARQTVFDFNTLIKAAVHDAVDEGVLDNDPSKKAVIKKGNPQYSKKQKFLSVEESKRLADCFDLTLPIRSAMPEVRHARGMFYKINWDYLFLICLKTGLRFSEALGLTPSDFDFESNMLDISKTYDYKYTHQLVDETKSSSSARKISMDDKLSQQIQNAIAKLPKNEAIFVQGDQRTFISTVNKRLAALCLKANVPKISTHALRHTHASILFYGGVSIQSISRRLGHADVSITQNTYLHLIKELECEDDTKILESTTAIG